MTKHTPGPWTQNESRGYIEAAARPGQSVEVGPEYKANLRLIAAAPELLAAAEAAVIHLTYGFWCEHEDSEPSPTCKRCVGTQLRAAIAKARGEE